MQCFSTILFVITSLQRLFRHFFFPNCPPPHEILISVYVLCVYSWFIYKKHNFFFTLPRTNFHPFGGDIALLKNLWPKETFWGNVILTFTVSLKPTCFVFIAACLSSITWWSLQHYYCGERKTHLWRRRWLKARRFTLRTISG